MEKAKVTRSAAVHENVVVVVGGGGGLVGHVEKLSTKRTPRKPKTPHKSV